MNYIFMEQDVTGRPDHFDPDQFLGAFNLREILICAIRQIGYHRVPLSVAMSDSCVALGQGLIGQSLEALGTEIFFLQRQWTFHQKAAPTTDPFLTSTDS